MARKKKKHQEDPVEGDEDPDVAEDGRSAGDVPSCVHLRGSVNWRRVRQLLLRSPLRLGECDDCQEAGPEDTWVCLQCGHRGCGAQWPGRHAVCHAEKAYSDSHALALSSQSMELWCYKCNGTVEASSQVAQVVAAIRKKVAASTKKSPQTASGRNSSSSSAEEPRSAGDVQAVSGSKVEVTIVSKDGPTITSNAEPASPSVPGKWVAVKGLSNLGNTCYFNAVMQCLSQTPGLEELLAKRCSNDLHCFFEPSIAPPTEGDHGPLEVKLPGPGSLTSALALFLREMRQGVPRPGQLFSRLCQVAPQFRGHHQHDSHELLRHLLEGVRSEEVKRHKQAVLDAFGLSSKVNPSQVGTDIKARVQAYKKAVHRVSLDNIFGGLLLSTLICQLCGQVSRREEPFQDLSLPIPEAPRNVHASHGKRAKGKLGGGGTRLGRSEALSGGGTAADPTEADEEDNASVELASQVEVLRLEEVPGSGKEPPEGSLDACLRSFTAPELLAGANGLHCEGCGVARAAASLQLQVLQPPRVLTLHLKRFQQGSSLRKVQRHVAFPVELDLAPYCSNQAKGSRSYTLYGVVEHSGRMTGGHYVAYVRGAGGSWFYASDGRVVPAPQRKVLACQAYLLFYGRTDILCQ